MAGPALEIFHIVGSLLDGMLDITDILSRLVTCNEVYEQPSEAAEALLIFKGPRLAFFDTVRHLLRNSRPWSLDRNREILRIHVALVELEATGRIDDEEEDLTVFNDGLGRRNPMPWIGLRERIEWWICVQATDRNVLGMKKQMQQICDRYGTLR